MPISIDEFWKSADAIGLFDQRAVREKAANAGVDMENLVEIAEYLTDHQLATRFQFQQLLRGEAASLQKASFLLREPHSALILEKWMIASQNNHLRWLYTLKLSAASELAEPPSLSALKLHSQVVGEGLLPIQYETVGDELLIATDACGGKPLTEAWNGKPLSTTQAHNIVKPIAFAAATLQKAGLTHARICLQSIWCKSATQFVLLRDPLFLPSTRHENSLLQYDWSAPVGVRPHFLHSEVGVATDAQQLAMLLALLLTGEPFALEKQEGTPNKVKLPKPLLEFLYEETLAMQPEATVAEWYARYRDVLATREANNSPNPTPPNPTPPKPTPPKSTSPKSKQDTRSPKPTTGGEPTEEGHPTRVKKAAPISSSTKETKGSKKDHPKLKKTPRTVTAESGESHAASPTGERSNSASTANSASTSNATPSTPQPKEAAKQVSLSALAAAASDGGRAQISRGNRRARATKRPVWVVPAVGVGSVLLLSMLVFFLVGGGSSTNPIEKTDANASVNNSIVKEDIVLEKEEANGSTKPKAEYPKSLGFNVRDDDGKSLWLPLDEQQPWEVTDIPSGCQAVLFFRPSRLQTSQVVQTSLQTLGDLESSFLTRLREQIGISYDQIDSLTIPLYPTDTGWPDTAVVVRLKASWALSTLLKKLPSVEPFTLEGGQTIYRNGEDGFFIPDDQQKADEVTRFTVTRFDVAKEIAESGGAVLLLRQLDEMRQTTSRSNEFTLISTSSFFFRGGRKVIERYLPSTKTTMEALLGTDADAFAISSYRDLSTDSPSSRWYAEFRVSGRKPGDAQPIGDRMRIIFQELPDQIENSLAANTAGEYWRKVAFRFPQMLRFAIKFQRHGLENDQAITNVVLPEPAFDNLLTASWLMMLGANYTASDIADSTNAVPMRAEPVSAETILSQRISISFLQESFDTAVASIIDESQFPLDFRIDGTAFEKEGITRNKEIRGIDASETPLREVLTELSLKANSTVAAGPDDPEQNVVWIIEKAGESFRILFTTRNAADSSDKQLPTEFRLQ